MKIFVSIVLVLLILAVGGGSGYYIWQLTGRIDELEDTLARSVDEMDRNFNQELESSNQALLSAIDAANLSLADYKNSTEKKITDIENDIKANSSAVSSLERTDKYLEDKITDSVLQTRDLYEIVKESIVRITDGEYLSGSGFVISLDSSDEIQIATAYHVVDMLDEIYITFSDWQTYKGTILFYSEEADVAILSLNTQPSTQPKPLTLADSGKVEPGDPVFVIGSPGDESKLGLKETVTTGVISQVNRSLMIGDYQVADLLQYDAAVNFGNSGGPLFNNSGEVIGVVNARMNPLLFDGIAFAIASNLVNKIVENLESLIANGDDVSDSSYNYPWTGISVKDIKPEDIVNNRNTITSGAEVTEVKGPAISAGINEGDIITALDDVTVFDSDDFYSFIAEFYSPGDSVSIKIQRGTETVYKTVVLVAIPG